MRRKRGNTNIKILQSQLQNLVPLSTVDKVVDLKDIKKIEPVGTGIELPIIKKIKKKGIPKNELINTKRLLTI